MIRNLLLAIFFSTISTIICNPAFSDNLSSEQGDAIISEIRQIRQLLEKLQKPEIAPVAPLPPERVRLEIGKEFSMGRVDAPLVMVEYTDYQCPYCTKFYTATFTELKREYIDTGKMRFISRDYPLDFHSHALKAAQATHCAGEQGKFWQMKDLLMVNSSRLTPEVITTLAGEASLDAGIFRACQDSGKYLAEIKDGIVVANGAGINGTPAFVIGKMTGDYLDGALVVGAQPFEIFDGLIKGLLSGVK